MTRPRTKPVGLRITTVVLALGMAALAFVRGCSAVRSGLGIGAEPPHVVATTRSSGMLAAEVNNWWYGGIQARILAVSRDAAHTADAAQARSAAQQVLAAQLQFGKLTDRLHEVDPTPAPKPPPSTSDGFWGSVTNG